MSAPDPAGRRAALRQNLGPLGIWSPSPGPAGPAGDERRAFAATVERQGFPSLWIGGGHAEPDPFEQLEPLLEGSARLVVGTGPAMVAERVRQHLSAGADHVVLQPLDARGGFSFGGIRPLAEAVAGV
jgi:alkanesulfonate monooxygenase SsuD/methylene tetrahydromethanopterin reductase-like flavin-dependent oxidoreductase (luciferase family)